MSKKRAKTETQTENASSNDKKKRKTLKDVVKTAAGPKNINREKKFDAKDGPQTPKQRRPPLSPNLSFVSQAPRAQPLQRTLL